MGTVVDMASFRKTRTNRRCAIARIGEIETLMRQNRNTLYSSNNVLERERAAIKNGELQMELSRLQRTVNQSAGVGRGLTNSQLTIID